MDKNNNHNDLLQTSIRTREVTYFLVSEQDLNDIKSKGLLADIFILLESLVLGGLISLLITKLSINGLDVAIISKVNVVMIIFLVLCIIFLGFVIFFLIQSRNQIRLIKKSGAIKSYNKLDNESDTVLSENKDGKFRVEHLLFSIYFTDKKTLNVTREIRNLLRKKQEIVASNLIAGDPDYGTPKKLLIRYLFKGVVIDKEFNEGEKVQIP